MHKTTESVADYWFGYITRLDLTHKAAADDPNNNYATHDAEIITCAPILMANPSGDLLGLKLTRLFSDSFHIDHVTMWEILQGLFQPTKTWAYVKPTRMSKDRHMYFKLVDDHNIGPNTIEYMAAKSKERLVNLIYQEDRYNCI